MAFTVGLLHDIGKLVLGQVLTPEHQTNIRALIADKKNSRWEAEKLVLGTDHAEVGGALLQAWNLPEEIIEAVANHHHPVVDPAPKLSSVSHLANYIAHRLGSSPGLEPYAALVDIKVAEVFSLTPARIENITEGAKNSCDRVDQLMTMG